MSERPDGGVRVVPVDVSVLLPLRRRVLRPGLPPEESAYDQDGLPTTLHLAAYDSDDQVVGCSTWFPEPLEGDEDGAGDEAWRLRGMATAPEVRGTGVGEALVAAGLAEGARRGFTRAWCNARTTAVGFYRRYGFEAMGEEFVLAHGIPHYRMVRPLP